MLRVCKFVSIIPGCGFRTRLRVPDRLRLQCRLRAVQWLFFLGGGLVRVGEGRRFVITHRVLSIERGETRACLLPTRVGVPAYTPRLHLRVGLHRFTRIKLVAGFFHNSLCG